MKTSQVEGVLRVLCMLRVLGVMQAANVHTNTLKAKRLLTRRSQASQILGQQLELRHRHGAVRWSRGWRGSTPGVATHSDPNCRGKHALWNYRIQRLIDPLSYPRLSLIGNETPFLSHYRHFDPSQLFARSYDCTSNKLPSCFLGDYAIHPRLLCVENWHVGVSWGNKGSKWK